MKRFPQPDFHDWISTTGFPELTETTESTLVCLCLCNVSMVSPVGTSNEGVFTEPAGGGYGRVQTGIVLAGSLYPGFNPG
jgi:hypothetical protein